MTGRMSTAEFVTAILREQGDMQKLFRFTRVDPYSVPAEIEALVRRANQLTADLDTVLNDIAAACGYDPDEEN